MRLDELPRSENVEDRRSAGFRVPGGGGGLGIGTLVALVLLMTSQSTNKREVKHGTT